MSVWFFADTAGKEGGNFSLHPIVPNETVLMHATNQGGHAVSSTTRSLAHSTVSNAQLGHRNPTILAPLY